MLKPALIALMLALTGCAMEQAPASDFEPASVEPVAAAPAIERVITLTVDAESLTADEQEAILAAVADWQALAAGRFALTAVIGDASGHGPSDVYGETPENLAAFLPEGSPANARVYGFTSHEHGIRLRLGMSAARTRGVVAHEIGHRLGLDHSADETAVMWPVYKSIEGPTASDAEALAAVYGSAP